MKLLYHNIEIEPVIIVTFPVFDKDGKHLYDLTIIEGVVDGQGASQ
jgi:hypothetical protein